MPLNPLIGFQIRISSPKYTCVHRCVSVLQVRFPATHGLGACHFVVVVLGNAIKRNVPRIVKRGSSGHLLLLAVADDSTVRSFPHSIKMAMGQGLMFTLLDH